MSYAYAAWQGRVYAGPSEDVIDTLTGIARMPAHVIKAPDQDTPHDPGAPVYLPWRGRPIKGTYSEIVLMMSHSERLPVVIRTSVPQGSV